MHCCEKVSSPLRKGSGRRRLGTQNRQSEGKGGKGKSSKGKGGKGSKKSKKQAQGDEPPSNDATLDDDISSRFDDTRIVQIEQMGKPGKCIAYNSTTEFPLRMQDCSVSGEVDKWEIYAITDDLFKLRHLETQLCIPENPEFPGSNFDCFLPSGSDVAIADSINGLVDCDSANAAVLGFIDSSNSMYLYNTVCVSDEVGADTDVILMTYENEDDVSLVVWGEKVLAGLPEMIEEHNLGADWYLIDLV